MILGIASVLSSPRHVGILEYMRNQGRDFEEAAQAFAVATGLEEHFALAAKETGLKGVLEKKWTSVVRLQRKVSNGPSLIMCN